MNSTSSLWSNRLSAAATDPSAVDPGEAAEWPDPGLADPAEREATGMGLINSGWRGDDCDQFR